VSRSHSWDIFCRVVDNFGDAGVCWRLARQLVDEHQATVRLWVNDLAPLHLLCRDIGPDLERQRVAGVEVQHWPACWGPVEAAEFVIEAFGCGLPPEYVRAMAEGARRPLWAVLEYLSAEGWVSQHHGLPSPHPRWPIPRYFFFPGFGPGSGGLLREARLADRRNAFDADARHRMWVSLGFEPPAPGATVISMFAYEHAPLSALFGQWAQQETAVIVAVPPGRIVAPVAEYFGAEGSIEPGHRFVRGSMEVRILPFVEQPRYDELLWCCDCNFVRGEDSFVRAQWAALPLVWQVYPQAEQAHWRKLEAFLDLYCIGLPRSAATALRAIWRSWNAGDDTAAAAGMAWREFWAHRATLGVHAHAWASRLSAHGDLAGKLAQFCSDRVKY
jgi:uncharacterized repeat protein (TIGR03837 family)